MPFKFDNFDAHPKIIPDATASSDGIMTSAQVRQIDGQSSGGVFVWKSSQLWSDVWAKVQAGGGAGVIVCDTDDGGFHTMTAGSYDFTNIEFVLGGPPVLILAYPGVLLDAGSLVTLKLDGVELLAFGSLMGTGSSKPVNVTLLNNAIIDAGSASALFDSGSNSCNVYSNSSSILSDGGGALLNLNAAAGRCVFESTGTQAIYGPFGGPSFITARVTGVAGSAVTAIFDALTQHQYNPASIFPAPLAVSATVYKNGVSFTRLSTVNLPTPSTANIGQAAYDTTVNTPKISNGTAWVNTSAPPVFSDGTRPAPNTVPVGTQIYNTSDNAPNYSDGTNWRSAVGVIT